MSESQSLIEEIDARQNEVLAELDALNEKIERLLNEVRPPVPEDELEDAAGQQNAGANPADPADPTSQLPAAA